MGVRDSVSTAMSEVPSGAGRITLYLAREQARAAGLWLLAAWAGAIAAVSVLALLAGSDVAEALAPDALLRTAALTLGAAIPLAMPLSVVGHVIRMSETGERVAAEVAGRGPATIAAALALPWVPLVAAGGWAANRTEPAAVARSIDAVQDAVRRDPVRALESLSAAGVAASSERDRVRVLAALGGGYVAIELADRPAAAGGEVVRVGQGTCSLGRADGRRVRVSFTGATLSTPLVARPLSWRTERELSSAFLSSETARFARARATRPSGGDDGRVLAARELRRRAAVAPAALAALGWVLLSLVLRLPRPALLRVAFAVPACACAALVPRLLGAW